MQYQNWDLDDKMSRKVYVKVNVQIDDDGRMLPRELVWEDGRRYEIDRVVSVRQAASAKVGGQGDRYTVEMQGQRRYLFFERSPELTGPVIGKWFVEGRD